MPDPKFHEKKDMYDHRDQLVSINDLTITMRYTFWIETSNAFHKSLHVKVIIEAEVIFFLPATFSHQLGIRTAVSPFLTFLTFTTLPFPPPLRWL